MGVSNIITFDAHDPRVQNSIRIGFESVSPTYQMIKAIAKSLNNDIKFSPETTMMISPDEGGMGRWEITAADGEANTAFYMQDKVNFFSGLTSA